jgi:putative exosortase-associated protein (TIGR04073 family)
MVKDGEGRLTTVSDVLIFLAGMGTTTGCGFYLAREEILAGTTCKGKKLKRSQQSAIIKYMKAKLLGLLLVFALLLPFRALAETDEAPRGQNALRKFGRGIANVLFGIVEVPNQITKVTSEQGGGAGATYGVGKGFVRWMGREFTGVYDIVTFPIPYPKGYKPIMHPEFPVEDYEP